MFFLLSAFCFAVIALYVAAIKWMFRVAAFIVAAVWELAHGRVPSVPR